jgi:transcriptional regulator with XRE-family HTH domain
MLNIAETQFAEALAVRVRNLRLRHALSQQELADHANLSRTVIINIERGLRLARPHTIRKIARAFDVPLSALTVGESE